VTGLLRPAEAPALADALVTLAADSAARGRLAAAGRGAALERTWDRALGRLAEGYRRTLESVHAGRGEERHAA
jgi:hypothetical protein